MSEKGYGPPDSANTLWYDPEVNRFEDEGGFIIHDMHQYFKTWELDVWKKTKDYGLMTDKTGGLWEVFYNDHGIYGRCGHQCLSCGHKCDIYDLVKEYEGGIFEWV
jgi:hypothetical protein